MSLISGSYSLPPPIAAPATPVAAFRVGIVENDTAAGDFCLGFDQREASKGACRKGFRGEERTADFCSRLCVAARLTDLSNEDISINQL